MKTRKILAILVLRSELLRKVALVVAFGLIVCQAKPSEAAPMRTGFTYQGHLYDNNDVADDLYDFQFKLYNDPCAGSQLGSDVNKPDLDVIDGYFTVELDFGSGVFDGNAVWLDIGVRPGEMNDPNVYTALSPRQEVTPTPYALHARWFLVDEALDNIFAGEDAGASNTTGSRNSAMGYQALWSNTTGQNNSAVGYHALRSNTTGYGNSAVGAYALRYTTSGYNSAMGNWALNANTTGSYNTAMGYGALYSNIGGLSNSAMGLDALRSNTTGNFNTAVGKGAGYNSTGNRNVFLGYNTGYNETGSDKLYIDNSNTSTPLIYGDFSTNTVTINDDLDVIGGVTAATFVGDGSGLTGIATGDSDWTISGIDMYTGAGVTGNVGIGTTSPSEVLDVNGNININSVYKIGGATILANTGTNNIFVGKDAGASITTGYYNSAVGNFALYSNTTGYGNSAVGYRALYDTNEGYYNSAVGSRALNRNTTGYYNSAVGRSALYSNTTGYENSAMGSEALYSNTTGYRNSAMGNGALAINTTGSYNSAVGKDALWSNTGGYRNSAMGYQALRSNTTGNNNAAIGYQAGYSNSTGSGNVFLGYQAGYNETGSNKLYIDNSDTSTPLIYGDFGSNLLVVNGTLDVKGPIWQRGGVLHADYVFEAGYELESIGEHSESMWSNKHLPAVPKAKVDETGMEIIDIGAHRRGIVEELEKAHIYIEQLHKRIKELKEQNEATEARFAAIEAVVGKLSVWQEGVIK